jgi:hypothetical protein
MGRGQISNLRWRSPVSMARRSQVRDGRDENVTVRCAAAAFDVSRGLMNTRALVLDTTDMVIYGNGQVSLASEEMDLTLRPYPKDMSILSLRSPLKVAGSFAGPVVGPDTGSLAGRAGLTLALAAVNPLLALATTVETGPGQDANCGPVLREAASPDMAARIAAMSQPPPQQPKRGSLLGGPAAPSAATARGAPGAASGPVGKNPAPEEKRPERPEAASMPGRAGPALRPMTSQQKRAMGLRVTVAATADGARHVPRHPYLVPFHRPAIQHLQPSGQRGARTAEQLERLGGLHGADDAHQRREHAHRGAPGFLELVRRREHAGVAGRFFVARVVNRDLAVEPDRRS